MPRKRNGPLTGLKVVELGHYIAAPLCTRILADLGSEVIKVEPPGGDPFRGWGAAKDGNSVWFSIHGRNKLSIVLDLKKDRETLLKLAARADVLVENMRAGQLERLKIGPDALHAVNPRLVIARISGYGQDGPYRDKPAFGAIGEAIGGLRHLTGHPSGASELPPPRCGISISDDLAGLYAAIGLLSALWERDARGGGNSDLIFARLMAAIGRSELATDPAYATNGLRCQNRAPLDAAITAWTRTLPAREAEATLEHADVPCSRLYDIADCAGDPHFLARKSVQSVADPLIGQTLHPGPAIRLDGEAPEDVVRWTGRAAGAHTEFVLRTLLGLPRDAG